VGSAEKCVWLVPVAARRRCNIKGEGASRVNESRRRGWTITGSVIAIAALVCLAPSAVSAPGTAAVAAGPAAGGLSEPGYPAGIMPSPRSDQEEASAPCVIFPYTTECTSSDPTLSVDWTNNGDTTGCMFRYVLEWGDGTTHFGDVAGGPAGSYVLTTHTYVTSGSYTVSLTGNVTTGNCVFDVGTGQFIYTAPAPSAPPAPPTEFTIKGSLPVNRSSSQDTNAQAPSGSVCQPNQLRAAKEKAYFLDNTYFPLRDAPDAITLLENFRAATGKPINFSGKSKAGEDLLTNPAFKSLNQRVLEEVQSQLNGGAPTVILKAPTLKTIVLSQPQDLYLSFDGTQGLVVTGRAKLAGGDYVGTLTYKIEDSYGYSTNDHLYGFGDSLRYLQTVCGNPPHEGGAHWFSDSVTATVSFKLPASLS
jgi:hypothetical protein